jgi:outer membrane protein assembly factor BamD (BamD/ComL family)
MKRWIFRFFLTALVLLALPFRSPAPLVYTPGEGWTYEAVGGEGAWRKTRAKDQLKVAQDAYDSNDLSTARKACERVITTWPLSDYAPQAVFLLGQVREKKRQDERAFKEYQQLMQKYPKATNTVEVLHREFLICNRFLGGERFRLWGVIPTFRDMDKTVSLYEQFINNAPYTEEAAQAQMNIGAAREKQKGFLNDSEPYVQAAKAYETAADRYHDRPAIAAEALYKEGLAYRKQALTAEYDQGAVLQAIASFQEFMTLYPDDPRVTDAEKIIAGLKTEQARGNFQTAQYYEVRRHLQSALIYYNEVLIQDPKSVYASQALERIAALKAQIANQTPAK